MTYKLEPYLSAVVYVPFFGRGACARFLPLLLESLSHYFKNFEIILVNDDHTSMDLDSWKALPSGLREKVSILDLSFAQGREKAMTAGGDLAIGDWILEFDYPVLSMEIELPKNLCEKAWEEGADIYSYSLSQGQAFSSRLFYFFLKKLGVTKHTLRTEAVRLVSRRALNKTLKERRSFRFRKILYLFSGYKYGTSLVSGIEVVLDSPKGERFGLAFDILMSFSKFGSSVSRNFALFFFGTSIAIGLYSIIVRALGYPVSEGWTTIMIFLTFGFSGIFAILASISRTLQLILKEVQAEEPYSVREISKLSHHPGKKS